MKYIVRVIIGEYVDYANFDNEASAKEYAQRMAAKKNANVKIIKK